MQTIIKSDFRLVETALINVSQMSDGQSCSNRSVGLIIRENLEKGWILPDC